MMNGSLKSWSAGIFGLALGTALTAAFFSGLSQGRSENAIAGELAALKLRAASGYGSETIGMVTGRIDENADGVFLLDYLTGELQCYVLSPRTGKFIARFKRNVVRDLQVESGKKPAFVIATGGMSFPRGGAVQRPADSVVYVADSNTGHFAVYAVPLVQGAIAANAMQDFDMVLLDIGKARNVEVRE